MSEQSQNHDSHGERICRLFLEIIFPDYAFVKTRQLAWLRGLKGWPLELDMYCPELGLALEYNGQQHYRFTPHFHSNVDAFDALCLRDQTKADLCDENDVTLVAISYADAVGVYDNPCNSPENIQLLQFMYRKLDLLGYSSEMVPFDLCVHRLMCTARRWGHGPLVRKPRPKTRKPKNDFPVCTSLPGTRNPKNNRHCDSIDVSVDVVRNIGQGTWGLQCLARIPVAIHPSTGQTQYLECGFAVDDGGKVPMDIWQVLAKGIITERDEYLYDDMIFDTNLNRPIIFSSGRSQLCYDEGAEYGEVRGAFVRIPHTLLMQKIEDAIAGARQCGDIEFTKSRVWMSEEECYGMSYSHYLRALCEDRQQRSDF